MKKGLALICMLLAVLMLSGCNLIGHDDALDAAQVVAKVNDTEITKAEWESFRNYMASYYQQYYQQYFGINMPMTEEDIASYGESALQQLIENVVLQEKMKELGFDPLSEEEQAEVETEADSMLEFYKLMLRYQNYPGLETVEEEAERLAAEAEAAAQESTEPAADESAEPAGEDETQPGADETAEPAPEAEPEETAAPEEEPAAAEPQATVTNAQLDEMLTNDLNTIGYTREYFIETETASRLSDKIREYAVADVEVTDEQVTAEFDSRVESQKTAYDETPTGYATAVRNNQTVYYVPAGYRGVKNLLVGLEQEDQDKMNELNSTLSTANTALSSPNNQLDELNAQDTAEFDEEALAAYNEQVTGLQEQIAAQQETVTATQAELDELTAAAFAKVLPKAQEALEKAKAGEDFDALIETYGTDTGMTTEPNKSRGYLVCEGLTQFVQEFQDAAMALEKVGDVSQELVETSYGYHILQYATDIESGVVELTDELKTTIHDDMLAEAQDAAYDAAVTQWVSEANVTTYPKVMK